MNLQDASMLGLTAFSLFSLIGRKGSDQQTSILPLKNVKFVRYLKAASQCMRQRNGERKKRKREGENAEQTKCYDCREFPFCGIPFRMVQVVQIRSQCKKTFSATTPLPPTSFHIIIQILCRNFFPDLLQVINDGSADWKAKDSGEKNFC